MSEAEAQSSGVVQAPANPNGSQPAPAGVLDTTGMTQAEIDAANDRISRAVLPKGEVFLTTNAVEKVNAKAPRGYRYEPVSEPQTQTEVVSEKRQRKQVQYSDYGTEMDFGDGRKKKGLSMKGGKRGQVGSPGSAEGSAGKKRKMKMMNPMMPFSPDMVGMSAEYMQQMMAMQMAMMQAMMAGQNPAMMANPAMMGAMMPNANMTPTASKPRQSASSSGKRKGGGSAGKQNSSWDASYKLLNRVRAHKDAIWFNEPVDVVKFSCPDYYTVIKNPMDLGTIKNKMEHSEYRNISAFAEDVRLVWANCRSYNYPGSAIVLIADNLSAIFEKGLGPIVSNFGDVMSASEVAPADVDVSYTPVAPAPAPKKKSSSDGGKDKSKKKKKIQDGPMDYERIRCLQENMELLPESERSALLESIYDVLPAEAFDDPDHFEIELDTLPNKTLWYLDSYARKELKKHHIQPVDPAAPTDAAPVSADSENANAGFLVVEGSSSEGEASDSGKED